MDHPGSVENVDAQVRLQTYLQPGEGVLWTGSPNPHRLFSSKDFFLVPFSLMWGGFAIFWEASVLAFGRGANQAPVFFALWGIPFVVVGQYFIWGRFLFKRWDRRRTIYAVTNQRVIVLRGRTLQSIFLSQLPPIVQSSRADGSGTLEFGSSGGSYGYGVWANTGMDFVAMGRGPIAFYDIANVTDIYTLINRARKQPE
jgi:hypothetical protein